MNTPKDNLEDFFQQSFSDSEIVNRANDWNVPSDAVWEGIQEGLTEERKLSFAFLKWPWSAIAASYLLLMGAYQFIEKNIEKDGLNTMVVAEEMLLDNHSKKEIALCPDKPVGMTQPGWFMRPKEETPINNSVVVASIKKVTKKLNELSTKQTINYLKLTDSQLVEEGVGAIALPKGWTTKPLDLLNTQNVSSLELPRSEIHLSPIIPILKKPSAIYISANYSTFSENLKQHNLSEIPTEQLVANEKNAKGNSVGLDIGWTNKKGWTIETGIHYTQIEQETNVNQVIPAPVLQANLNVDGTNNLDVAWNDINGTQQVGLIVNNTNNSMVTRTDLSIKLAQNTKSRFIDVPLLVRKSWKLGKVDLSIKTGLLNRFNISTVYETPTIALEGEQFEVLSSEFQKNTSIENTTYIPQLIAGIGLEYFIQSNLSVYVEPTYSKSLRPIIDFGFANIHSQNKALTMGMRYHL